MAGAPLAPPVEVVELTVDCPFLFLLQDRAASAVLFLGRVMNPVY